MDINETTRPGIPMGLKTLVRRILALPQIRGPLAIRALEDDRGAGFSLFRTDESPAVEIAAVRDSQDLGHLEALRYATLLSGAPDMSRVLLAALRRWGKAVDLDEEINGCEAVDWLSGFVTEVRGVLQSMAETATTVPVQPVTQNAHGGDAPEAHGSQRGTVRVFFTRAPLRTVDIIPAHDVSDDPRGQYSGETLAELRPRHPGIEIGDICAMAPLRRAELHRPPVATTKDTFREAMEVVPPFDHCHQSNGETFKAGETTCGGLADIHVRIGDRFWMLTGRANLSHDEIIGLMVDADDRQVPAADRHH